MKQTLFQKLKTKLRSNQYKKNIDQEIESIPSSQYHQFNNDLLPKWFKNSFSREQAEDYLRDKEIGTFIIRESETILDCFVLSVKCSKYIHHTGKNEISNYIIIKSSDGFIIRGNSKRFHGLISLVTHCSVMRDILPVLLNLDFYKSDLEKKQINDLFYYTTSTYSTSSSTSSLGSVGSTGSNE